MAKQTERDSTRRLREATLKILATFPGLLGVRQIWYRLISPPFQLLPQSQSSYKGFDRLMVRWRETGVVPPGRIADRSTFPTGGDSGYDSPQAFLGKLLEELSGDYYGRLHWADQKVVPIVYIEKDTLTAVIEDSIKDLGVAIYPTRGVASFTKLWKLAREQRTHVLYLTDHDATGVFMDGDFRSRLDRYGGEEIPVTRIALTTDQVRTFKLPPNPVHPKDSRSPAYVRKFGDRAWELDALPPDELGKIVRKALLKFVDRKKWAAVDALEEQERLELERRLPRARQALQAVIAEYG